MSNTVFVPPAVADKRRFQSAIAAIDAVNEADPRRIDTPQGPRPFELHYARRLTHWTSKLAPQASEALALAARGQHVARWEIPRDQYPDGLKGYTEWRETLKQFHAGKLEVILRKGGYDDALIGQVKAL
ncbi:MAG TPA: DUF4202 family protein, partial [Kiritimatiellia bacterium]